MGPPPVEAPGPMTPPPRPCGTENTAGHLARHTVPERARIPLAVMWYLAGRGIGHAPNGGYHGEGSCRLIGGLLPAGGVVGVRAIAAHTEAVKESLPTP